MWHEGGGDPDVTVVIKGKESVSGWGPTHAVIHSRISFGPCPGRSSTDPRVVCFPPGMSGLP
jgi:hypothetical protein